MYASYGPTEARSSGPSSSSSSRITPWSRALRAPVWYAEVEMTPSRERTARPRATLAEFLAIPEEQRFHEIIDGEIVPKAMPGPKHSRSQRKLAAVVDPFDQRPGGPPERPGGWWILTEAEVLFEGEPLRPDLAG